MNISIIMFGSFRGKSGALGPILGAVYGSSTQFWKRLGKGKTHNNLGLGTHFLCLTLEELKRSYLEKKAKFLPMISGVVAALLFKHIMPSRHCLLT